MSVAPGSPGRSQLLAAALHVVASRGARGATVRTIAAAAGVTPGLVVHHFGTKERLLAEVDALVAARFTEAMTIDPHIEDHREAMPAVADGLSRVVGGDSDLRGYLRRSILEATPGGVAVFSHLVDLTIATLRRFGGPDYEPEGGLAWLAIQIVTINLAGLLLEPVLVQLDKEDPFSKEQVARRTRANLDFISRALGVLPC
ncbi:MAG: TetR/AcrR family transcriptional regulator [Acidimicrobiales bacterium]